MLHPVAGRLGQPETTKCQSSSGSSWTNALSAPSEAFINNLSMWSQLSQSRVARCRPSRGSSWIDASSRPSKIFINSGLVPFTFTFIVLTIPRFLGDFRWKLLPFIYHLVALVTDFWASSSQLGFQSFWFPLLFIYYFHPLFIFFFFLRFLPLLSLFYLKMRQS